MKQRQEGRLNELSESSEIISEVYPQKRDKERGGGRE